MVEQIIVQKILQDYDSQSAMYEAFSTKIEGLLKEILNAHMVKAHSITSRLKKRNNLSDKLNKPDSDYSVLSDITDISGARITTYFSDEVDVVAKIIESEFTIDTLNSVDKRKLLDPDRFGYLSLHYVVSLTPHRTRLPEYQRFSNVKAEIQIRSILQHAWAEIEHDHGYKNAISIPRDVRRQFSRLAGLLELADEEFLTIRNDLDKYAKELPEKIANIPETVSLDRASFIAFVNTSSAVNELDNYIAGLCKATLRPLGTEWADRHVKHLSYFGIRTISDLDTAIQSNLERVKKFSNKWLHDYQTAFFTRGIGIFYLYYLLLGDTSNKDQVLDYLNSNTIGDDEKRPALADRIIETSQMCSVAA